MAEKEKNQFKFWKRSQLTTENPKQRAWTMELFEDSCCEFWRDLIEEFCVETYYIYHDKDINADGTPKKPHYHVLMYFPGKKAYLQLLDFAIACGAPHSGEQPVIIPVNSLCAMCRYLVHRDNAEKYQYNEEDVHCINSTFQRYIEHCEISEDLDSVVIQIEDFIEQENIVSFWVLCMKLRYCPLEWSRVVKKQLSIYFRELLKSRLWTIEHEGGLSNANKLLSGERHLNNNLVGVDENDS